MSETLLSFPQALATSSDSSAGLKQVRKRDGRLARFDLARIGTAITKAVTAELGAAAAHELPAHVAQSITDYTERVARWCDLQEQLAVESIQDEVERVLMTAGEHRVARRYVLYRESQAHKRKASATQVRLASGELTALPINALEHWIAQACELHGQAPQAAAITAEIVRSLPTEVTPTQLFDATILALRSRVELEPVFTYVAAKLLLDRSDSQLLQNHHGAAILTPLSPSERRAGYQRYFPEYVRAAVARGQLHESMLDYDLEAIAAFIVPERDSLLAYLGVQTLYDRYFLAHEGLRVELPQIFWMRIAMGLALGEQNKLERVKEFYDLLSLLHFTSATPTLFNAGTCHPQLSSCYLSTVEDDLVGIFKAIQDNAILSKWAGGLGNDWTNIRALGATIRGTGGKSQGIVPFLKVVSDAAVAVNQGGKRKGAVCAYLETWHLDIEEFLELRRTTGDERRRTHDLHTANWIPDLFMKRVLARDTWTLFSPNEVPDLHHTYGREFEQKYLDYEQAADEGRIKLFRRVSAVDLWRKMLTLLFETGHPWVTWKDPSNIRSPQDHVGVVHNSNLCTEILLNNSAEETAVCNLGSVNLGAHITDGVLDLAMLERTIRTAVRMLDNVIDLNFYPTPEAANANLRHRPIGLGLMGFQDALYAMQISYASDRAVQFADESMEAISYFALLASSELARERGKYASFAGSKWDRGYLPIDTIDLVEQERGIKIDVPRTAQLDWEVVRRAIREQGLRNSNVLAIAPTATISNIAGVSQSIEPTYRNLYVKSNLSGEFTQVNEWLVEELKGLGLWSEEMLDQLKYYDGELAPIAEIPAEVKERYRTAFEIEPRWLIECAARRQKWIDMGQSLNLYLAAPSGRKLDEMYFLAWKLGLKTTYYLRTLAATQVEKSTIDVNRFGIQPRWMKNKSASGDIQIDRTLASAPEVCNLGGDCEACQ